MIETLIASSVLIGSVCLIRYCGKGRIRPLFLYGLWGLVYCIVDIQLNIYSYYSRFMLK